MKKDIKLNVIFLVMMCGWKPESTKEEMMMISCSISLDRMAWYCMVWHDSANDASRSNHQRK